MSDRETMPGDREAPGSSAQTAAPRTLALTPSAVEWVKRVRTKEGKEGQALRLGVKAGGCSGYSYFMGFTADTRAGDLVLSYDGLTVYVDPRSLEILDGTTVDYERGLLGSGIQFKNPRVKKSCGCGESFSL
jgi:iron-sulfur cluster assembly accessory protein